MILLERGTVEFARGAVSGYGSHPTVLGAANFKNILSPQHEELNITHHPSSPETRCFFKGMNSFAQFDTRTLLIIFASPKTMMLAKYQTNRR